MLQAGVRRLVVTTVGPRLLRLPTAALDHRRFWGAMDAVSVEALTEIQRRIAARAVAVFGLEMSGLVRACQVVCAGCVGSTV